MNDIKKKQQNSILKILGISLLSFILLTVFIYFVSNFTFLFSLGDYSFGFSLGDKPSEIGDAIGGITSPIINVVGAILIYKSFMIQKEANDEHYRAIHDEKIDSSRERNFDTLFTLFNKLEEDFRKFEYSYDSTNVFFGSAAISYYNSTLEGVASYESIFQLLNSYGDKHMEYIEIITQKRIRLINKFKLISNKIDSMNLTTESELLLIELYMDFYINELEKLDSKFVDIVFPDFILNKYKSIIDLKYKISLFNIKIKKHKEKQIEFQKLAYTKRILKQITPTD